MPSGPYDDRSARRKSVRTLIERTIIDNVSEDEDEELARRIYGFDDKDNSAEEDDQDKDGTRNRSYNAIKDRPRAIEEPEAIVTTASQSPT